MTIGYIVNVSPTKFKTTRAESPTPNRAYSNGGTMSEMRYANTKILIVTCYLLLPPFCLPSASLLPPLQVPFFSHSKERTWNGLGTD